MFSHSITAGKEGGIKAISMKFHLEEKSLLQAWN